MPRVSKNGRPALLQIMPFDQRCNNTSPIWNRQLHGFKRKSITTHPRSKKSLLSCKVARLMPFQGHALFAMNLRKFVSRHQFILLLLENYILSIYSLPVFLYTLHLLQQIQELFHHQLQSQPLNPAANHLFQHDLPSVQSHLHR